ncbi:M23 family metallopeptidase [Xanthovirga aplysinae]|uniref:M23 family metallopeptidase n=1 Tax=Xanthovirga aplysinae TaxID=2529853 RepID=UPI001656B915|nr:M23 family metallopeptidase [Xanthovirga aplysinae]
MALILGKSLLFAQSLPADDNYQFPIRPGKQNFLAGTMGEIRSTHIHAGLDIKTGGQEGLAVFAAQKGFISRIKISTKGYGNVLYMKHPDGSTTVYAHLQKFIPEIRDWVRKNQYEKKSFAIELFPSKDKFQYEKGELIAYSGNSGSSSGPHLHFEIRDNQQKPLDPLSFNFSEIKDNIPPNIIRLGVKPKSANARIFDQHQNYYFSTQKTGNVFKVNEVVPVYGEIALELQGYDQQNGSYNRNGIQYIEMQLDGETVFSQHIKNFSFAESRNALVVYDYEEKQKNGRQFTKLFVDNGNSLSFYSKVKNKGLIVIKDTLEHQVRIYLRDSYQNESIVKLNIIGKIPPKKVPNSTKKKNSFSWKIIKNFLKIESPLKVDHRPEIKVYANRIGYEIAPIYTDSFNAWYLWDLKKGLPDSLSIYKELHALKLAAVIPPNQKFSFFSKQLDILFPYQSLFDTLYLTHNYLKKDSQHTDTQEIFTINDESIPLRKYISVTLRPENDYKKFNTGVFSIDEKNRYHFEGGKWKENEITFRTRNLGKFTLLTDSIPPTVKLRGVSTNKVRITIDDQLSGISDYRVLLNDQWVLFQYDPKRKLIWAEKEDFNGRPINGNLKVIVSDKLGNETIFQTKL